MTADHLALLRAVAEKHYRLLIRYWVNTTAGLAAIYIMFVLVFLGGQAVAPVPMGETLPAVIVGFFVWSMAFASFQDPAELLMREAQWGTLEQLYMMPMGLSRIVAARVILMLAVNLAMGFVLLVVMMISTGRYLVVDLVTVVPLSILTLFTAVGLGFAFGGLALIYKRIGNVFLIVQFMLLAALAAPSEPYVLNLLPLTLGFDLLSAAMENGTRLWELPAFDLGMVVVVGVGYLIAGAASLRYSLRVARKRGLMGHY